MNRSAALLTAFALALPGVTHGAEEPCTPSPACGVIASPPQPGAPGALLYSQNVPSGGAAAAASANTVTLGTEDGNPAVQTDDGTLLGPLEPGANSFTEGQARSRIEAAGFTDVGDLRKDDQGIWRGRASRGGQETEVGLDYRGNVGVVR